MKLFLKNILILFIIILVLDPAFLFLLKYQENHLYDTRLQKAMDGKISTDILILGSSRGARNIIAAQIQDSLHESCYNLSYPGSNLDFHQFILQTFLKKNKKPKTILLTIDDSMALKDNASLNFRNDVLYPLAQHKYINDVLIQNNENPFISKYLYTFRVEKSMFKKANETIGATDTLWSCGSMPIVFTKPNYTFQYNEHDTLYSKVEENPKRVENLKQIQSICKQNNIQLILVFPPNYKVYNSAFEARIKSITGDRISYFVYNPSELRYTDSTYYYDMGHLKLNGARIFTNELIDYLRLSASKK